MPLPTNPTVGQVATDTDGVEKVFRTFGGISAWAILEGIVLSQDRPGTIVVDLATTEALDATFSAANQELTSNNNEVLTIDGTPAAVTDLILVKDAVNPARQYIFEVTAIGSAGAQWTMKVWDEFNDEHEVFDGASVTVKQGAVNKLTQWSAEVTEPFVFGGSAIAWVPLSAPATDSVETTVTITKAGHGLAVGAAVNYALDLSDVLATHSDENEYNGVVSAVAGDDVTIVPVFGGAFTWTAHGLTEPFYFLGTAGDWVVSSEGAFPAIGLIVVDENTVQPVAIPQTSGTTALEARVTVLESADNGIEVGRGNSLPADNADFELFLLAGHAVLPNALYYWSLADSQWYQG